MWASGFDYGQEQRAQSENPNRFKFISAVLFAIYKVY